MSWTIRLSSKPIFRPFFKKVQSDWLLEKTHSKLEKTHSKLEKTHSNLEKTHSTHLL